MRTLEEAPSSLTDASGEPRWGSFAGGLPVLDFGRVGRGPLWRLTHHKRWSYVAIADENVFAGLAVVSVSYAATVLAFVLDRKRGELVFDASVMGPASATSFEDGGPGRRGARFGFGGTRISVGDERVVADLPGRAGRGAHILVEATDAPRPTPIGAVVPIEGGFGNATEKRLVEVRGEILAGNRRWVLDRAVAGFDHTAGYLARHTAWRWAFGLGFTEDGHRIGFNLVEGFVGEAECGGWLDGALYPFGEGRFEFSEGSPLEPWRVRTTCGGVDLRFAPAGLHAEHKNLGVVKSKFIQPVGAFEGTIRFGERTVAVRGLPGVTEHQDVLW
ncbi:MAG: DUF2804 domain-containing protein [Polyangiaceae bacterium]